MVTDSVLDCGLQRDKHSVLIAAQPSAFRALEPMFQGLLEIYPAHTVRDALKILEDPQRIDLIICTVAFDESRMFDLLQLVKENERTSAIPFIGCRILVSVLTEDSIDRLAQVCKLFGAADFVDVARLEKQSASMLVRKVVMKHVGDERSIPMPTGNQ